MVGPVRFFFDYVSPYAYLASTQIRGLAARHGRDVEAVPVLFAAMLNASGGRGPAEIPLKRRYMHTDIERTAARLGVPIEPPASHPFNPLVALRVTGCVGDAAARLRLVDALFQATWVSGERVEEAATVARIADRAGFDGASLLEAAASAEGKARLRRATDDAVAEGAFGVPTMVVDSELFWGVDSLTNLERGLSGECTIGRERFERWNRVTPSATRAQGTKASA